MEEREASRDAMLAVLKLGTAPLGNAAVAKEVAAAPPFDAAADDAAADDAAAEGEEVVAAATGMGSASTAPARLRSGRSVLAIILRELESKIVNSMC
jgi:hypothetical protein